MTRIVLRPVASSLPLGFFAFGTGTVLLSALELQWVPAAQGSVLMAMVLAFVVPLELLAGVFAFLARDGGAATALTLLGAAWTAIAVTILRAPPGATSASLGIFLLTLATLMLMLSAGALRSKPLLGVLLAIGACRFVLSALYELSAGGAGLERASGWTGVPLVALSLYSGLAFLLEEGAQRTVLPLGRRGRARTSLEGGLGDQIERAESEPGVRRQL
ncbi:MAG TPA: GPR1/FUN34/YaaH family transporter [Streptosporangiaceae bacterium]